MKLRTRDDLRESQVWLVRKLKRMVYRKPGAIVAWDMGAGKTGATLTALRDLIDEGVFRKVLIIAPLLVAEKTWPDEIEEWRHTRVLSYSVITGTQAQRAQAVAREADIYTINRENVGWLWQHLRDGSDFDFDCIVIDEASMLKNGKIRGKASVKKGQGRATRRLTRLGYIAKMRAKVDFVIELTGTPAPKGLQNLWGLAYIVDQGERLGAKRTAFEQRWFEKDFMGWNLEPKKNAEAEIMDRLSDVMFSLHPDDYAELPPMVPNIVEVRLPKKVIQEYRRFERTLVSETYDVEAVSSGALANKLLQFANGSLYNEDGDDVWVHDEKLDALEGIIEEANGTPVLCAYNFKFDLNNIRKRFKKAVVLREDPKSIDKWNAGEIPLLLAHPMSAGHGLNLQKGGNISVWYGLTHDLELYQQFNKRLHRPGQTRTVFNHHIVASDTIDEDILPTLKRKDATQAAVLKSVVQRVRASSTAC